MSRSRSDALTGELFSTIPTRMPQTPASMDFRKPIALMAGQAIKDSPADRYEIAAVMSRLAGHDTSASIIDSYTAVSREECNLPLWKAPLFEIATGTRSLAEWHASVLGGRVLWGAEITDADIGRTERQIAELQDQLKGLRQFQRQMPRGAR